MIFRKIKDHYKNHTAPIIYNSSDGIQYWREKILLILIYFLFYAVGVVYIPSVYISVVSKLWLIAVGDFLAYPLIIYLYFSKRKSVKYRAYIFLAYLYVLSIIIIIYLGNIGAGHYWLFAVAPIAAILIDSRAAYSILILNIVVFTILGYLGYINFISIIDASTIGFSAWIIVTINFLFANSMVTIVIVNILNGLQESLIKEQNISKELEIQKSQIIESKNNIEKANRLKTNFLAQISHEIRTPISNIMNYLFLLDAEPDKTSSEWKSYMQTINNSGLRLIRTVDMLMNLSEVRTGNYEILLKPIDIYDDILKNIIKEQKIFAEEKNLKLSLYMDEKLPIIYGDHYSYDKIYSHLIENAIKFTDEGEIIVSVKNKTDFVEVEISDSGIGIDKEYLEKLFQPFTQEEEGYSRKYEGNGIGLSIVKSYCDLNKISIDVKTEKGKGTKIITLLSNLKNS